MCWAVQNHPVNPGSHIWRYPSIVCPFFSVQQLVQQGLGSFYMRQSKGASQNILKSLFTLCTSALLWRWQIHVALFTFESIGYNVWDWGLSKHDARCRLKQCVDDLDLGYNMSVQSRLHVPRFCSFCFHMKTCL